MSRDNSRTKVALMVNMLSPLKIGVFSVLADQFDLLVLHGGREANRDSWNDVEKAVPNARVVRAWGWQIHYTKKLNGEPFDEKFIHITPGFAWHLFRFQPDLVISNELGFRSMIALAYGTAFRKPVWLWWGGTLHSERHTGRLKRALRRVFTLWANRWITYGQAATDYLLHLGLKRDRILQSQNAIDEERFKASADAAWTINPRPVVLYTGQLIERKGVGLLLDAAASVQQRGHEFSLLLVGNGREKGALERRARDLGLKNVHFRPAQSAEKMPSVYRSADLLVLPTLEDIWGLVANEAILSGIPVLCSKYAGCASELFTSESIFSPKDLNEFAQKLEMGVSGRLPKADPRRLKTTVQLGRELVQELKRFAPEPPASAPTSNQTDSVAR
jgi:glycosyltransferase involved in cell wall biosynthesis